ncbi:MAG: hypothetical protein JW771_01695 [Candidatus Thermoplasmatota archaeon]|nr:hypothetical protein [Candidatus Thermoplasmatota archaeon]
MNAKHANIRQTPQSDTQKDDRKYGILREDTTLRHMPFLSVHKIRKNETLINKVGI